MNRKSQLGQQKGCSDYLIVNTNLILDELRYDNSGLVDIESKLRKNVEPVANGVHGIG